MYAYLKSRTSKVLVKFFSSMVSIYSVEFIRVLHVCRVDKGKGSPYLIAKHRVPELIPVLGSQPAGDVSHKPSGRLPLLFTRSTATPTTLKRAATNFAA